MLSKCANPGCSASFLYLHEGKLFRFDTGPESPARPTTEKATPRVEFFWLCRECAAQFTLRYKKGVGISTVALSEAQVRAASAS
jgi:hypothetical protein